MRHRVLLLTSLVHLVLAPRPPDERGSPRRFGKDPGELAPGAWGAQLLGEEQASGISQVFGGRVLDDGGASRSFRCRKGVWLSESGK